MRRLLPLLTLGLALLLAAPAHAGELIDRAVAGLENDNIYIDPDADPTLTSDQVDALRDRIVESGAAPLYVVVAPEGIRAEGGGDPGVALAEIAQTTGRRGTYVIVAGPRIEAVSTELERGEAGRLARAAAESGGDAGRVLLGFTDRVADAQSGDAGEGSSTGGLILLGLIGAGGAAVLIGRRRKRARDAAEFAEAKRNARDDLVALGDDIRALDVDASMPGADPQAVADYDHAVARYTEAEEQWDRARRPAELAPVGAALEEGRWAMASAKARFAGQTPPERRPPCFFDPRHGPSSREVEWSPPFGSPRSVPACEADAQRVERGEDPQAREVEWAGARVPYWQAGPAYAPYAGGFYGGGLLPGLLIGSMLGGAMTPGVGYASEGDFGGGDFGGGDFGGGDFGGGGFGDFGGGGDF
jgi:LPXTG-motif cell wall-anchored protein